MNDHDCIPFFYFFKDHIYSNINLKKRYMKMRRAENIFSKADEFALVPEKVFAETIFSRERI